MKLIKLSFCAFGPYKKEQTIDFSQINDRKLFLISGPTGAGKTTIFDAISYALYGYSSGNGRDGDSLRSDFASIDSETYVSLAFQLKGKNYYVRRRPRQLRKKLKGEGTTIQQGEAELTIENGKTYTGIYEVNNKIQEILGINYDQFKQIVMLPQGEFRQLLEASSQDRESILRRLFKTEDFLAVQERLKEKTKDLDYEIKDSQKLLENDCHQIMFDDGSELEKEVLKDKKDYETIMLLLREKIEEDEKKIEKLLEEEKRKEKEIFQLTSEIEKGQLINQKYKKVEELKTVKKDLLEKEVDIKTLEIKVKKAHQAQIIYQIEKQLTKIKASIEENKKNEEEFVLKEKALRKEVKDLNLDLKEKEKAYNEVNQLEEKVYYLKDKLTEYQVYEEKKKELEEIQKDKYQLDEEIKDKEDGIKSLEEKLDEMKQKSEINQKEISSLSDKRVQKETIIHQLKEKQLQLKVLKELVDLDEKHQKLSKLYQNKLADYKDLQKIYEDKFDSYLLGQAGILAKDLRPHTPCPVCGSTHHPKKASLLENVCTTEELEELKIELGKKEKIKNDYYSEVLGLHQTIEDKKKLYRELSDIKHDEFNIQEEVKKLEKLLNEEEDVLKQVKNDINILEEKTKKQKELEALYEKNITNFNQEKESLHVLKASYIEVKKTYQIKLETIEGYQDGVVKEYQNKEALEREINQIEKNICEVKDHYHKLLKEIERVQHDLLVIQTDIKNLVNRSLSDERDLEIENKKFNDKLNTYDFTNIDDYKKYLYKQNEIDVFESQVRNYYEELSYVNKTLQQLQEELKDKKVIEVNHLIDKQNIEKKHYQTLREEEKALHLMLQNNYRILNNITLLYKNIKHQLERYEMISTISSVANGNNPQRLTFERYVLAAYFDDIIAAANLRLSEMTNNRYFLCRKEEKGKGNAQQGLDLEVVDNYTSKNRLVKTLSGGEAFIASLSLALGLADVVQSHAGGIELDTIFIDEGFGSLDPESLEQAISTLINIQKSGRLVGIISHVQELKERIDVKLEITSSQLGSTAKIII